MNDLALTARGHVSVAHLRSRLVNRLQILEYAASIRFRWCGIFNANSQRKHSESHEYDQCYRRPMKLTNRLDLLVLVQFRHVITSKFDVSNLRRIVTDAATAHHVEVTLAAFGKAEG
ncbi:MULTISPECIES: hypothetical protein [unclassified Afipia]|uniref:hypothetical protein n=1 Tax=unclassified Afipia TaxID=2642050 RepID=UPI00126786CE|nr:MULTISPECIES: hypothetical protein [unclassified Afipia]